ncbi:MAG: RluA family pseudouridine synthase [Gemmatimonadota bacterium]
MRLDRFLRLALPGLPARSAAWAIASGDVRVGGARAAKGRIVREGEEVAIRLIPEQADWLPRPADLPGASVLYEDAGVTVLDKPPGAHSEPHRPGETGTLAGYLLHLHPAVAEFARAPGLSLLSRLDFAVSGAVPAALSAEALRFLVREREEGRMRKIYACLVHGNLDVETTVSTFLETRGGRSVRARADRREPDPRYWTVASPVRRAGATTLVRAAVAKGRRHQVRAHLAAAGFPIVGDALYGAAHGAEGEGGGLMLHAAEVSFVHPGRRERVTVRSPLPRRFDLNG